MATYAPGANILRNKLQSDVTIAILGLGGAAIRQSRDC